MRVKELFGLAEIEYPESYGDIEITEIVTDSRRISKGCAFICIKGAANDGHRYIGEAIEKGASVIVAEQRRDECVGGAAAIICVENTRRATSLLYNAWYGKPSEGMRLIGITGTNGKTSVSFILKRIFENAGHTCGVIGTVGAYIGDREIGVKSNDPLANMTTPDPEELYKILYTMRREGVEFVFMETTSHALSLRKTDALRFDCAVFTNLTRDHLDFHGDMESYFKAKALLFEKCDRAVINVDDPYGERLSRICGANEIYRVSTNKKEDFYADGISYKGYDGIEYLFCRKEGRVPIRTGLVGSFFVANTLFALSVAEIYGIEARSSAETLRDLCGVDGRMEKLRLGDELDLMIDYAHTPDALEKLLLSVRGIKKTEGRIILLFGCGGDRDRGKRKEMGQIASKYADFIIITSDNSRSEDSESIIGDILKGINKEKEFVVIEKRERAIEYALSNSAKGDVIILAGKGHERYEIDSDGKHPFDERKIAQMAYERIKQTEGRKRDEGQYRLE